MCPPGVLRHVHQALSRRDLFKLGAGAALAGAFPAATRAQAARTLRFANLRVAHVQDLTHPLSPRFPVFPAYEPMRVTKLFDVEADGFFANRWDLAEHTGTHLDAPAHFIANGVAADGLEPESLLAPVAVIDLRERAAADPDTALGVDDLTAWEAEHGPLPDGAAVFLYSGWDARAGDARAFLNADAEGTLHFPGFSPEAAAFLVSERRIVGVGVDTPSLDIGAATRFDAHVAVLGAGLWGLENLANLGRLPPLGATVFVGAPAVAGASGGPARVLAVWS
ncbi:cyclase family protein [Truepera radiovictrix]|uniref:Cyclase family protein n=1 Tax=Truepera radiovictrix (strain DSM 17093 / CIP 108686 / LMG 22925 / RQ-24) TaxID=649638 RepID=D7CYD0_TRURR|nr:cyclase family protein [Truepera radiovictrix]ADI14769.1 cyclase family protein [Truepera radiovictrix DSM 17093]WMT56681.1 cyclase family protein [Truepera radiovictrix]